MSDGVSPTCRACSSTISNKSFEVSERYFGGHGRHSYVECETCGSIQMVGLPTDIGALYPPLYRPQFKVPGRLKRWLLRQRAEAIRGSRRNLIGRALAARHGTPEWAQWMAETNTALTDRILDVGSSDGELLVALSAAGYRHLTGIDPYIAHGRTYPGGVRVIKRRIEDHTGEYDLIMLNHSLEHMPDPIHSLAQVRRMVASDGWVMVRLPVAGGYGWRTYREHWFGLEAPRHLVIPTAEGMEHIAAGAGFVIAKTIYDGHGGYYAMSEAALAGHEIVGPRRPSLRRAAEIYGRDDLVRFQALAAERNAARDGDTAAFFLRT